MNSYSHLLFKRGFLLTDSLHLEFKDELTQNTVGKWKLYNIGKFRLYYDGCLPMSVVENNRYKVALLGLVLNPFDEVNDIHLIAKKLLSKMKKGEEEFLDYLDELSGRFVIITQTPYKTEVYNDACGTRTVYYNTKGIGTTISSHSSIIADLFGYKKSKIASDILTSKDFIGRKYLPGLMSPYDEIKPLSPNTKYHIEKRSVIRIFPRDPLPENVDTEELVSDLTSIMRKQASLLCENHKISISLTAGLDSRLTYSTYNSIDGDINYFTHMNINSTSAYKEDIRIGSELAKLKNVPYTIYEYPSNNNRDEISDFKVVWEKNLGFNRGSMLLYKMYADKFPENRVHVRSNIAEIARVFYKNRTETLNPKKLARLYTRSTIGQDPHVISSFQDFINTAKFRKDNFFNFEYQDLFYWEHRMPMWHSWIVNESDVAYETFVPYNNRVLLKMMLSAPFEIRGSGELFVRMINEMWPETLQFPVNKEIMV
ncbi:hypothetical protein [Ornithinibacillus massiliensis]|nr:hypothetical protein [Ornithinibacillus massiliensis]